MRWNDAKTSHPKLNEPVLAHLEGGAMAIAMLAVDNGGSTNAAGCIGLRWMPAPPTRTDESLRVLSWARVSPPEAAPGPEEVATK